MTEINGICLSEYYNILDFSLENTTCRPHCSFVAYCVTVSTQLEEAVLNAVIVLCAAPTGGEWSV
jgi:hypothetical protein